MSNPFDAWRAKTATSLLILFTAPFAMGMLHQAFVPVIYALAVFFLIRFVAAAIRRRH